MAWTSWLDGIPIIGKLFSDAGDIIKEAVVDKDKQNQILETLETIKQTIGKEMYIKELETKTIPWVDGLHKMGRQILNALTLGTVVTLLLCGKTITPEVALILGGGNMVYQWVKGRGESSPL